MALDKYEAVIGLEVHAELSTKTKVFCSCPTTFGAEPNTQCCPVCMAMPGSLPVLNKTAVEYAIKTGLATQCEISTDSKNDRKNYFYPDLPKAYQISQYDKPLCRSGFILIPTPQGDKKIRINRIHIEEDSGKLNHVVNNSLVDLNRAGVPLIEIVSEPDLSSSQEVDLYLKKLKTILEYIEVSDCKMQEGSLRADVNVSIRPKGETALGTRTEMKNMNSFAAIVRAVEYEIVRQIDVVENGGRIVQSTLRWDDVAGKTISMRNKENAQDYRYFPEPDLIKIAVSEAFIENIRTSLPELPDVLEKRYINKLGLSEYDARFITSSKYLSIFFENTTAVCNDPKSACNWIMGDISRMLKDRKLEPQEIPFTAKQLGELILLVNKGDISSTIAKEVLDIMTKTTDSPTQIVKEKGLLQVSDESAIKEIVQDIIAANPKIVAEYKAGKERVFGFLVGQAMKASKGKANPQMLNTIFESLLKPQQSEKTGDRNE